MGLADSIQAGPDPFKTMALTFGMVAEQNNRRKALELQEAKLVQDAILEQEALRIRERAFGLDMKQFELQKLNTESLIAERERKTNEALFITEQEMAFNKDLNALSPDGRSLRTILDYGTPEEKEDAWNKYNTLKDKYGGIDAQGIQRTIREMNGTTFAQAKQKLATEKEAARQAEFERTAGQRDESNQIRWGQLAQTEKRDANSDANAKARIAAKTGGATGGKIIKLPAAAGGRTLTEDEIKITIGKAYIKGAGTPEWDAAERLQRELNTVGLTKDGKFFPTYGPEDWKEWGEEGKKMILEGKATGEPALPTDPVTKAAADAPLMPEEMPLEGLYRLFPSVKRK